MEVQIFGVKKSKDTRAAQRFFAERRVKVHFSDLDVRPAAIGELRRFSQKFGVDAILDRESKRFKELGLGAARYGEEHWLGRLADEPGLLKLPLVRFQQQVTVGLAEDTWKGWLAK